MFVSKEQSREEEEKKEEYESERFTGRRNWSTNTLVRQGRQVTYVTLGRKEKDSEWMKKKVRFEFPGKEVLRRTE